MGYNHNVYAAPPLLIFCYCLLFSLSFAVSGYHMPLVIDLKQRD